MLLQFLEVPGLHPECWQPFIGCLLPLNHLKLSYWWKRCFPLLIRCLSLSLCELPPLALPGQSPTDSHSEIQGICNLAAGCHSFPGKNEASKYYEGLHLPSSGKVQIWDKRAEEGGWKIENVPIFPSKSM